MARRIVSMTTQTPTATADTTDLVDATYPFCLIGGSTTQRNLIWEVSIAGQAPSSSSPTFMILGGDSQVDRDRGLPGPALLADDCDGFHA